MLSRRALVGKVATGVAGAAVGVTVLKPRGASASLAATDTQPEAIVSATAAVHKDVPGASEDGQPPWELVAPLTAGAELAGGWQLASLSGRIEGAYVATLKNAAGRQHRLHLCRAARGANLGIVQTGQFDLVVMNGGTGDLPTDEGLAQAVAALARTIQSNEAKDAQGFTAGIASHAERLAKFAAIDGAVLR